MNESPSDQLRALAKAAWKGDSTAADAISHKLDDEVLWSNAHDIGKQAEDAVIRLIAGDDERRAEGIREQLDKVRCDLKRPDQSILEDLMVDRIAVCWLHLQSADLAFAQANDASYQHARFLLRRQQSTQNRYFAAVRALAQVRKLLPRRDGRAKRSRSPPSGTENDGSG